MMMVIYFLNKNGMTVTLFDVVRKKLEKENNIKNFDITSLGLVVK